MIRMAEESDVQAICDLLKVAREESPFYSRFGYNELRTAAILTNFIHNPKAIIFVDDDVDCVVVGEIIPDWLTDGFTASIHLAYAKPGVNGLKAINAFKTWATGWPQVNKIFISSSFGGERADAAGKLFERMGYDRLGSQYMGEL